MGTRLQLHNQLQTIMGTNHVYYQPPESLQMSFPCIVYELNKIDRVNADNASYLTYKSYTITVIDRDPDSSYADAVSTMARTKFDRWFKSNGLNQFVFTTYI